MRALALFSLLGVLSSGRPNSASPEHFSSWRGFFSHVASRSVDLGLDPKDLDSLFALAAESAVTPLPAEPSLILVEPHFYRWKPQQGPIDQLRGASGNGDYYLLQRDASGFLLIGRMWGNGCEHSGTAFENSIKTERFKCKAHASGGSHTVTEYQWDGKTFRQLGDRREGDER